MSLEQEVFDGLGFAMSNPLRELFQCFTNGEGDDGRNLLMSLGYVFEYTVHGLASFESWSRIGKIG